jgi:hypothetical protein
MAAQISVEYTSTIIVLNYPFGTSGVQPSQPSSNGSRVSNSMSSPLSSMLLGMSPTTLPTMTVLAYFIISYQAQV